MGSKFRFLHCADLHIGSAFTGLSRRIPALDGVLSRAPFLAWHNTVETAIREKVDFVLIAGDCFDRSAPSLQGRLEFRKGIEKLNSFHIPVFVCSGNHDPWPQAWSESVRVPENVTFFHPGKVQLHQFLKNGETVATIGGIGHGSLNELENLAVKTGTALKDAPGMHIACVHANLCGDLHAAPASPGELTALSVDYWALGHVHSRRIIHEKPYVVYSGCTQGKDIHEPGVQGCYVVDCDGFGGIEMTFHPTSVLEFQTFEVNTAPCTDLDEMLRKTVEAVTEYKKENTLLFRLKLTGVSTLDSELRFCNIEELRDMVQHAVQLSCPDAYLEEIIILTRTPLPPETALVQAAELEAAEKEISEEKILESVYEEMRTVFRELPVIRKERFEELRKEGSALLAELLTTQRAKK